MVGRIFRENRATFAQLDVKQTLKVAGRFIHNDPEGMKRAFAKAEAKMAARDAVFGAIQALHNEGDFITHDLRFLDSIISKARGPAAKGQPNNPEQKQLDNLKKRKLDNLEKRKLDNPEQKQRNDPEQKQRNDLEQKQRNDPDFRVALFDAAWKELAGKGKLGILLRKRGGPIDGTRALKSDLRKLAEAGNWEKLQTATEVAAVLDAAKKFQTGKYIPGQEDEIISKMKAALEKLGADVPETGTLSLLSDTLGKALTEFLYPEFALAAAGNCLKPGNQNLLDHQSVLKLFKEFFVVLSSAEIWSNKTVNELLYEYYGLALNIAALEMLSDKTSFTKQDIALLKSTLKDVAIPEKFYEDKQAIDQRVRQEMISDALDKIDLNEGNDIVLLKMSWVCALHYIDGGVLNLNDQDISSVKAAIGKAKTADDVIEALKVAFGKVLKSTSMDRETFFKPMMDSSHQ